MALSFDPAIAAHTAFREAQAANELGADGDQAATWQTTFSESAGEEATAAYRQLLALGERHPAALAFHQFLIYSTWQQAAEDPIAEHFQQGLRLCDRFLARTSAADHPMDRQVAQIRALRISFLNALGINEQDEVGEEYDRDAFKGGD